jgi:ribosomal subunit interface protein
MQITITARHGAVPEALRERAAAQVRRLARLANRPTSARVEFDFERQRAVAEVHLNAARGTVLVASAEAADPRTALDRMVNKLRRQLDKRQPSRRRAAAGRQS